MIESSLIFTYSKNTSWKEHNSVKFIHIADVHLGLVPDREYPWSKERAKERWETLKRVISYIHREKIDLLLISGDLFHGQPLLRELKELNYLFSTISFCQIVIIAGNHDYLKSTSHYLKFPFESNVHLLQGEGIESIYLSNIDTRIYGMSYRSQMITTPIYDGVLPTESGGIQILMVHGGDEKHIPFHIGELGRRPFDYIALGHIHKPEILIPNKMAYAGSLEPTDSNDLGKRGFIEGIIEEGRTSIVQKACSYRRYIEIEVRLDEKSTDYSIQDEIQRQIEEQGNQHIYKILFTGFRSPQLEIDMESLYHLGQVVSIKDDSSFNYNFNILEEQNRDNILGRYIQSFQGKELKEKEREALYSGVKALLEMGE